MELTPVETPWEELSLSESANVLAAALPEWCYGGRWYYSSPRQRQLKTDPWITHPLFRSPLVGVSMDALCQTAARLRVEELRREEPDQNHQTLTLPRTFRAIRSLLKRTPEDIEAQIAVTVLGYEQGVPRAPIFDQWCLAHPECTLIERMRG